MYFNRRLEIDNFLVVYSFLVQLRLSKYTTTTQNVFSFEENQYEG